MKMAEVPQLKAYPFIRRFIFYFIFFFFFNVFAEIIFMLTGNTICADSDPRMKKL